MSIFEPVRQTDLLKTFVAQELVNSGQFGMTFLGLAPLYHRLGLRLRFALAAVGVRVPNNIRIA